MEHYKILQTEIGAHSVLRAGVSLVTLMCLGIVVLTLDLTVVAKQAYQGDGMHYKDGSVSPFCPLSASSTSNYRPFCLSEDHEY